MPPKGRKSGSGNLWFNCEKCSVLLSHKDIQQHNDFCPPDSRNWEHSFIKDDVLFSYIEYCNLSEMPNVRHQETQFFVYLSQSAMQLCHFEIGQQVVVVVNNKNPVIRTVWPTTEKTITSVIMPLDQVASLKRFEENSRVKIQKLAFKAKPALIVYLSPCVELDVNLNDQLLAMCKQIYTGKLLNINSDITLSFYGKIVNLTVKEIVAASVQNGNTLEDQMKNLNMTEKPSALFHSVVETSEWRIYQTMKKNNLKLSPKAECLKDIGGYKEIVQELLRSISHVLEKKHSSLDFSNSLGILLYGTNGVGKTFILQAIANEMNIHIVKINSGELFSKFYGETELRLRNLFTEAKDKSPSIILIDNIDTLCTKRGGTEQERRVVTYLLSLLDSLKYCKVVVLASTSQLDHVDTSLRRPGRIDYEIELPIPSVNDRFEILKVLLSNWTIEDAEVLEVAKAAHGYVAADLKCLVNKAVMKATSHNEMDIHSHDLYWALTQIKPSAMREILVQIPNVKWSDIGGMDDLKLKLQQAIEWPLSCPAAFTRLGIKPPRGILMYGPPGCSKTMIAKALATESKLNFLSIKGSDLFSKWVGESEKAVQSLFRKARAVAPSIVFLDELDAVGGERSSSSEGSNVQERVLAQLLTEMDGIEALKNVNIVAATNRPDRIDKALLRPGRLDRMVYVPLPDLTTRVCILKLQLEKMPIASTIEVDDLALKTERYSGAEIIAVCHEAAMNALQENFSATQVCEKHFSFALDMIKPRTPTSLLKLYNLYLKT